MDPRLLRVLTGYQVAGSRNHGSTFITHLERTPRVSYSLLQDPEAIIVMLNHDLVAIDCKSPGYPCFQVSCYK